jgi:hypothetical protein
VPAGAADLAYPSCQEAKAGCPWPFGSIWKALKMLDGSTFSGQRQWGVAFTYPTFFPSAGANNRGSTVLFSATLIIVVMYTITLPLSARLLQSAVSAQLHTLLVGLPIAGMHSTIPYMACMIS